MYRPVRRLLKHSLLYAMKYSGIFAVSRYLTRRGLRILSYHGISLADEHRFEPGLFMTPATFRQRLVWLARNGYRVLPLGAAIESMYRGDLVDYATVITADDGWFGTYHHGVPVLAELGFPATLYVTTYYVEKETPVFNVLVQYMFWRTSVEILDLSTLNEKLEGGVVDLTSPEETQRVCDLIIDVLQTYGSNQERHALVRKLGVLLQVDADVTEEERICGLMTGDEIRMASEGGVDIQLHTHRHPLLREPQVVEREIHDNRAALSRYVTQPLTHFCYPSGVYDQSLWPELDRSGIRTATTTNAGFNYPETHRYELKRFLDANDTPTIIFEAELCGALELLRRLRTLMWKTGAASGGGAMTDNSSEGA